MADVKYDIVERVEIGFSAVVGQHTDIENIVSFADRLTSPDDTHLDPISIINNPVPRGVHHNQKLYEIELVLDSHNHEAFYNQQVQALVAASQAIRQGVANDFIEYFRVFIRESDSTQTTYNYECEKIWCVGELHEHTMERGERHQGTCTYRLVCLGTRTVAGW